MDLSADDRRFLDAAEARLRDCLETRRAAGQHDAIVAVARSPTGELYAGVPLETSQSQFDVCAERAALAAMERAEPATTSLDDILVAGPVPEAEPSVTTPCGACRHAIHDHSPEATVFCSNFVREGDGWTTFPTLERYTAAELYPHRTDHPTWE
ncbi:hypothetical protein ACKVMT_17290 [Halobacteriales archaeon Cl-PHB]